MSFFENFLLPDTFNFPLPTKFDDNFSVMTKNFCFPCIVLTTPYTRDLIINYNYFLDNFYSFGNNNLNERIFEGGKTFFLTQKGDINSNIFTDESRIPSFRTY